MRARAAGRSAAGVLGLCALVAAILPAAISCSGPNSSSWPYLRGDENGLYHVPADLPPSLLPALRPAGGSDPAGHSDDPTPWPLSRRVDIPLPEGFGPAYGDALGAGIALFLGDVRGGAEPEIVLHNDRRLAILDLDGRLLVEREFTDYSRIPYGLVDLDSDGKLDVLAGSRRAARPSVAAVAGNGAEVFRVSVNPARRSYSSLAVGAVTDEHLVLLGRETWPSDPRGLAGISLASGAVAWDFFTPSSPIGLIRQADASGRSVYTASVATRYNGEFISIGTSGNRVTFSDTWVALYQTNADGELLRAQALPVADLGRPRIARFYPLGPEVSDDLLLVMDIEYRRASSEGAAGVIDSPEPTWLYRVDGDTGEIEASRRFEPFELADFRILPGGRRGERPGGDRGEHGVGTGGGGDPGEPAVFALLYREGQWSIETLDRDFGTLASRDLGTGAVALGAVALGLGEGDLSMDGQTPSTLGFVYENGSLNAYDLNLDRRMAVADIGAVATGVRARFSEIGETLVPTTAFNRRLQLEHSRITSAGPLTMALAYGEEAALILVLTDAALTVVKVAS